MKAVCIKSYVDKITKKIVKVGDVLEITEKRFEEITKAGKYIEAVKKEDTKTSK